MSTTTVDQVLQWTADDVTSRLVEEGVDDEVVSIFREKGIDGKKLLELNSEEKLVEFGVKSKSVRKVILSFLSSLSSSSTQGALKHDPKQVSDIVACPLHMG